MVSCHNYCENFITPMHSVFQKKIGSAQSFIDHTIIHHISSAPPQLSTPPAPLFSPVSSLVYIGTNLHNPINPEKTNGESALLGSGNFPLRWLPSRERSGVERKSLLGEQDDVVSVCAIGHGTAGQSCQVYVYRESGLRV